MIHYMLAANNTDDGVKLRQLFHKLRSTAIESLNEQFKGLFDGTSKRRSKD